ncbi:MAG TPA: sulfatase, partial [Planctomycetaceae bacterium]|nr:sulfatase [Planctomycetaceae bacterium]
RAFLGRTSQGVGAVALASLAGDRAAAAPLTGVLAPPPLPQRAKRVIWLSMAGGPSHLETFDHKPK